ncbi:uncharacterized protein LOC134854474 isoform X3 [Symsagittifera roscoffensis]|uniref:uncharacterized protein LOC134854474 isoform X3 n=1 Tax=Symsagittifera roscoffensis TaxID=84072 RepID=UPI00307B5ACB
MEYSINQVISKNSTEDAEIYFVMEGFCTVVKCLLIDTSVQKSTVATSSKDVTSDMANGSEDSEPKSSSVDFADLLNDQMKAKKKSSAEALRKFSESQPITKNSLFQAMDMTYENDLSSASSAERKNQSAIDEIIREQKEMDLESKLQKQREKELKTMKDSTHSFTVFVSLTEKSARFQNKTAVFLQVGRLEEGDVFNIRDSMNTDSNQTDLILVSEKCKLLKVKVLDFVRSLRNQELFLFLTTKIKKMKTYCPDEKDMIKLYKRNCNWEAYGQSLVNKSKKKDLLKQKQEADLLLGKPWRADPEYWLAVLREKTRKMEIKTNQPLKPPIY